MAEDRLDVSEFLKNDLMVEHISKTRRILGVFEDELYCYLTEETANTRAACAFIDEINEEEEIKVVIISEITDDDIQTILIESLSKKGYKFRFVTDYNEKDGAYIVIITQRDVQRNPQHFETHIPRLYLDNYGKVLCRKHFREVDSIDPVLAKGFKKETLFDKGSCAICNNTRKG